MAREYPPFRLPHSEHGEPHCPGLLFPVPHNGGMAAFECNKCGAVVRTVPLAEVPATIHALRVDKGEGAALVCPHCGETNQFPGCAEIFVFTCRHCGTNVAG
jgi:hypothetical protein